MKEEDLVKLMDEYMKNDGYYVKPQMDENGKSSFLMGNDDIKIPNVENLEAVKEEKEVKIFASNPGIDCMACASIPNISDIDK